ncbi:BTAD domain-containing putative transcriptional regulator [Nonomuraea sp. NPDC048916]|uniref:AfsR/SARP family transcriptional regulator n=1 Tax=Nonomuraea sp. NPDC048916 TaxID=3154232 RepID=UPI0033C3A617
MNELRVRVLGMCSITKGDGHAVPIRSAKARALLCYLMIEGRPYTRSALAGLLWGERAETNARGSLRLALMELRRTVGDHLTIAPSQVAFDRGRPYSLDWEDLVADGSVPEDYRGGLLDDLAIPDAPRFDDWVAERRRQAGQAAALALRERACAARRQRDHEGAARVARRLLEIDPLDEGAHRMVIEALAAAGDRAGALTHYETCRRVLDQELGIPPDASTEALRRRIVAAPGSVATGEVAAGGVAGAALVGAAAPEGAVAAGGVTDTGVARRLPCPLTGLVGRDSEVEQVAARLRDHHVRLLTLTGPGGVGKTRLAIATGERFDGDVLFVSFAGVCPPNGHGQATATGELVTEADAVVLTLAQAIGVDLTPPRPARDLLLAAVRDRRTLLILDNLEHLPAMAGLAEAILSAAPGVRILATSRRRLGSCAEHVHEVPVLPDVSARALFVELARRLDPHFDADPRALARICSAVGGLPLAVELAASLTRALTCDEIADRLAATGDPGGRSSPVVLLEHPAPATNRHASMRQVFDASWRLLTVPEQRALTCVSVFAGGFTLAAALEVAATGAVVIARLADHSLVRRDRDGRYRVHELVRQCAVARLSDDTPRARHAAWYARFLGERAARLRDHADEAVLDEVDPDMDNIRLAWRHIGPGRAAFAENHWTLCLRRHYYAEALSIAADMIASRRAADTDEGRAELARWHRLAGIAHFQFERGGESLAALTDALAVADRPLPATRLGMLGTLAGTVLRQSARRLTPLTGAARSAPERALAAEAARTLSMLGELGYHRQDQTGLLLAVLRHLDAAERSGGVAERAEAYANVAVVAALAGFGTVSRHYGRQADEAVAAVPDPVTVSRARLARGLLLAAEGRFGAARETLTSARRHPADRRLAEHCQGLLAELEVQRGRYAAAAPLLAAVAGISVARMGDELSGYWCLTGQAEAMLRLADVEPAEAAQALKAARVATSALPRLDENHFARAGGKIQTIQRLRLGTLQAQLCLLDGDVTTARRVVIDALRVADRPDMPLRGTLEAWAGLAEVLRALRMTDPAIPRLLRHMGELARRTPSAAPRMGWAAALLLDLTGRAPAARRAATRALAAARRLGIAFDEARSYEALGEAEHARRLHAALGTAPLAAPLTAPLTAPLNASPPVPLTRRR